jgi:serine/threonine protein kinase/WD40 repeat protein
MVQLTSIASHRYALKGWLHPRFVNELQKFLDDCELLQAVASSFSDVKAMPMRAYEKTVASGDGGDDYSDGEHIRYVGEYEIIDEIARGGMGVVFKARQQSLNRVVALKMILAGRLADQADVERFHREAQAAGRLQHRNIVPVHEIGEYEGQHYFTMDFVDGQSLSEVLLEAPLAPKRACRIMRVVAEAVEFAHQQGTLHRDLKPANVLLTGDDVPHVTDFGLAKMLDSVGDNSRLEMTASGHILGTPSYMSPEQAAGKQALVGVASDVYALGATLYACLTGRGPFVADSPVDTLLQVMQKEPVSPRLLHPAVPRELETICLKCLDKEPHRRADDTVALLRDANTATQRALIGESLALAEMQSERDEARRQQRRIETLLYATQLKAAKVDLDAGHLKEAREHLDSCRADVRSWEHDYLSSVITKQQAAKTPEAFIPNPSIRQIPSTVDNWMLMAIRPDGNQAVLVGDGVPSVESTEITIFDLHAGEVVGVLAGHGARASAAAYSPDGRVIVTGAYDGSVKAWDTQTLSELFMLPRHQARLNALAFSSDGRRIVSSSGEASFPPDLSAQGQLIVYDMDEQKLLWNLQGHPAAVTCAEFSPDGRWIASGGFGKDMSDSGKVRLWDANSNDILAIGRSLARAAVIRWSADQQEVMPILIVRRGTASAARSVVFTPDGQQIVSGGQFQTVHLWDVNSGEELQSLSPHSKPIMSIDIDAVGNRIASASFDGVKVWDRKLQREVVSIDSTGRETNFYAVACSPDGQRFAAAASRGRAYVWSVSDSYRGELSSFTGHARTRVWPNPVP